MIRAVYLTGTVTVAVLVVVFLVKPRVVPFPEAMLPVELGELASIWLAAGFFPMAVAAAVFYRLKRRRIIFVPAAVCLGFLIFWAGVVVIGLWSTGF